MSSNKNTDLSSSATQKAIARLTASHPSVVYSAVTGFLGMSSALLLGTGPLGWMIGAGGLMISGLAYLVNYYGRRDKIAGRYFQKLLKEYEQRRTAHLEKLQAALKESGSKEGESQFRRLNKKFDAFNRILREKLNPEEITYARYMAMAEQVYLGTLDNLQDLANVAQSLQSLDPVYIKQRLEQIKDVKNSHANDEREALLSRLDVYDRQILKVQRYLAQNEEAITRLDEAVAAVTDLKTEDSRSRVDLETAMDHLQDIAKRTAEYNRQ